MTDSLEDTKDCPFCGCLKTAHHGPGIGCEGVGGNCGCMLAFFQPPQQTTVATEGLVSCTNTMTKCGPQHTCNESCGPHSTAHYCPQCKMLFRTKPTVVTLEGRIAKRIDELVGAMNVHDCPDTPLCKVCFAHSVAVDHLREMLHRE